MEKLKKLIDECKGSVCLVVNPHKNFYESVEEYLKDRETLEDTEKQIVDEMIKRDLIIDLQFFPDTPIGSYNIYHYDLDLALDEAFECLGGSE